MCNCNLQTVSLVLDGIIHIFMLLKNSGSGAPSGKILLVRIVKNDKIGAYFRAGYVN